MAPEEGDIKEISILNRRLRYGVGGIEYEADPKHRDLVVEYFGLGGTMNSVDNGDREDKEEESLEAIASEGGGC
eukprot:5079132-Karenia_brevis.AAC.1